MRTVYAVWGPSAEWSDGRGVLGYAATKADAEDMIRSLMEDCREYGPRSWAGKGGLRRSDYDVVPVPLEDLPPELRGLPVEQIVERLNQDL